VIAQLTGTVAFAGAPVVVLDVNGVGYQVSVPLSVLEQLPADGGTVTLLTRLLVREDDMSLYGFVDALERHVFDLLLTVTGVGPKAALALLSALGGTGLARAVADDDLRSLTKVPGIGAKTGQRLILELKDKLAALGWSQRPGGRETAPKPAPQPASVVDDVVSALVNLGYNRNEAAKAASAATDDSGPTADFPALLRASLQRLTR